MGVGKEAAERVLGEHLQTLNAEVKDDNQRDGVTVRYKCTCMSARKYEPEWISAKGRSATFQEAGRNVAERILQQHKTCLSIQDPAAKRNWLDEAILNKEHDRVVKAKVRPHVHANAVALF